MLVCSFCDNALNRTLRICVLLCVFIILQEKVKKINCTDRYITLDYSKCFETKLQGYWRHWVSSHVPWFYMLLGV